MQNITDEEAWRLYPQHHKWFNKLYIAELEGYACGPSGVAPTISAEYIIKPTYNLSGMGIGARLAYIEAGDYTKVEPGYFWCDYLQGNHYSVTYVWRDCWEVSHTYQGFNEKECFTKFFKWIKVNNPIPAPNYLNCLSDVNIINVEYKDNKPFEVHLRGSPDPEVSEMIPIWQSTADLIDSYCRQGYTFIESFDNADNLLKDARVGFMIK
jgi:hypothetical protein